MKAATRHRQILRCAKKVFAERGFHAANISHICKEAGIGRGTLYQYFRNKKDVFAAVVGETLSRVQDFIDQRKLDMPPPETLTRAQVVSWSARRLLRLLEVVFEDEATLRILLREAVGLDVDIENLLAAIDDGIISVVERDLTSAMQAGIVRELNPRITATLMVGAVEKAALTALRSDETVNLEELATEAARLHGTGTLSDRVPE